MQASASHNGPSASQSERNSLNVYLDDAGSFDLMNAEDERRLARQIRELRRDFWRSLLSMPSCVDAVVRVAVRELGPERVPEDMWQLAREATRAYDEARDSSNGAALAAALELLADKLAAADVDRVACEMIADDIEAIAKGERPMNGLRITIDPECPTFVRYRHRVARSRTALRSVRNRFVCANLRLVVRVAQRYGRQHMSLSDRVQEGNLGLMKAVDRFDGERGIRFSTYAAWWIRHNITRALVNRGRNVRVPAHLHNVFSKIQRAERSLRGELGRDPTLEEIAASIKVPFEKVRIARDAMELRSVPLELPDAGADTRQPLDLLENEGEFVVDQVIDDRRNASVMRDAFSDLDPMERDILMHRFGLEGAQKLTLQSLGKRYSLSRERIRQVQNRALAKLRGIIEASPMPAMSFA